MDPTRLAARAEVLDVRVGGPRVGGRPLAGWIGQLAGATVVPSSYLLLVQTFPGFDLSNDVIGP